MTDPYAVLMGPGVRASNLTPAPVDPDVAVRIVLGDALTAARKAENHLELEAQDPRVGGLYHDARRLSKALVLALMQLETSEEVMARR